MDENSVKECGICNEQYDEDERCPRSLPCSHCFCSFCIDELIKRDDKKCPVCRIHFRANNAKELGKNTMAIDLLRYIKNMESRTTRGSPWSRSELVQEMKKSSIESNNNNLVKSKNTVSELKTLMEDNKNLKINFAEKLMKLKYDINTKIRELEASSVIKMQYMEAENTSLENELREAEEKQQECDKMKTLLDEATTVVMADSAVDEAEASNEAFQTWILKFRKIITSEKKIYQGIEKSMKNIAEKMIVIREVLTSPKYEEIDFSEDLATKLFHEYQKPVSPQILQRMNSTMKCLVSVKGIYAVKQQRCAKISLNEKHQLCLHALRDEEPRSNACTIEVPHDDVMKLVDQSSRLAFLEIGHEESTLGRIYIRLSHNTKRAQNFSVLCTGEMGPTYLDTTLKVRRKDAKWDGIWGGGYKLNEKVLWKALIPGAENEEGGVLQKPALAGSVFGICESLSRVAKRNIVHLASIFAIVTKDLPGDFLTVFGRVESGLDILNEIVDRPLYPNINELRITDCGVVLSR